MKAATVAAQAVTWRASSSGPRQNAQAATRTSATASSDVSDADRVRSETAEVDGARLPRDPLLVMDAELRAREQDRGAEALDLQVPLRLRPEAVPDPARSDQEERDEEHGARNDVGDPGAAKRPHAPHGDGQHDRRIQLDRRAGAEERAGYPLARGEQRDQGQRGQKRGHRVVAVQEHRPHQHGRRDGRREPPRAEPEPPHERGRAEHDPEPAGRHQELEHEHVVRVPDQHRQREHRHRAGRVLVIEVAVRDPAVQHERPPVLRVGADVARVRVAEEPAVGNAAGNEKEHGGDGGRPIHTQPLHGGLP